MTMEPKKILLTFDLSEESLRSFLPMAAFAVAQGAEVTLLHVVEDVPIVPHGAPLAPPMHAPSIPAQIKEAEERIIEQASKMPEGLKVDTQVITAPNVAEAVTHYADEHDFDLIALSSHGRSGFRRLILGSVAEAILRHAHVPVLVFPRNK
jgi:nucleotide-binding universal stress UspA family protein